MGSTSGLVPKATIEKANLSFFSHVKWEHLAAGVSGGVISTLVLHPLDLIKVRFQVNEGLGVANRPQYKGIADALGTIKREGGIRGLYQGVTPNIWGAGASWGLYFFFYNSVKRWMQNGDEQMPLSPTKHMLAASEAGALTLCITNPIWVVKTRLCLQYDRAATLSAEAVAAGHLSNKYYSGMLDALVKIYRVEGIRGLYKGFLPGLFGVSHGALQFMAYEEMKNVYNTHYNRPIDTRLSSLEYIAFAALSKIFAASATYPYQVVRSRLQDQHRNYGGVLDVIKQTWRYEGAVGFYKGMRPYLLHVTPSICIVFLVYETITSRPAEQESFMGFYKGLAPSLLRVTPACCITFLCYENMISFLLH